MQEAPPAKYKVLRDELIRAIRSGEFKAGQRLPAERELAARFGVSHMTARQAVTDLVEFELLDRRSRSGIYVRANSREKLSTTTLNLICYASDDSLTSEFLKYSTQHAKERGWRTRITRSFQGYERPIVRTIEAGEPALVFLDLPGLSKGLREAMVNSRGRVVLVGNRYEDHGVSSVLADDRLAVQMALAHLREAGHEKIALVMADPEHPVVKVQIDAWRDWFAGRVPVEVLEHRIVHVSFREFHSAADAAHTAVAEYLRKPHCDATAMLCLDPGMALAAMTACREAGLEVPGDMSFICTLDCDVTRYSHPRMSVIDVGLEKHIQYALELVDAALEGEAPPPARLRLVEPVLIERDSVRPLSV